MWHNGGRTYERRAPRARPSRLQRLRDAGFDRSEVIPFGGGWRVRCSSCEALVINNVATHETGCPNIPRREEDE